MDTRISDLLDKQEITELSCKYMRGLDRWDADLLRSVFFDDAYCEYGFINGGADDFVAFAIDALQTHAMNQHMLGNILIELEGNEAFGEVYFQAYHKLQVENEFTDIIIAGRYLDRYEKRDGIWKMAYRAEVVDWSRSQPTQDSYFQQVPDSLFGARREDRLYDRAARSKQP